MYVHTHAHELVSVIDYQINPATTCLGIGILYKVDDPKPVNLFSFMDVFKIELWLYMIGAYVLSSLIFFVIGR